jgi:hypothetical protein
MDDTYIDFGSDIQWKPLPLETYFTGALGLLVYLSLIIACSYNIRQNMRLKRLNLKRNSSSQRFYLCILAMSLFELPRFIDMFVNMKYSNSLYYSMHCISNVFFFAAFSIICYQYQLLLQMGSYFRMIYGVNGLLASNVFFGLVDLLAIFACLYTTSLQDFFDSTGFVALTFIEGVRNCVYSLLLSYFGIKLLYRLKHYKSLSLSERNRSASTTNPLLNTNNTSSTSPMLTNNQSLDRQSTLNSNKSPNIFSKALKRLTIVLTITTACFLLRVIMLIIKMIALHTTSTITGENFTLFGIGWFILSDFIPRALPSSLFMFLFLSKKKNIISDNNNNNNLNSRNNSVSSGRCMDNKSDDFQFVKLANGEELKKEDNNSRLFFGYGNDYLEEEEEEENVGDFFDDDDSDNGSVDSFSEYQDVFAGDGSEELLYDNNDGKILKTNLIT